MKRPAITLSGIASYCQTGPTKLDVGQTVGPWPDYCTRFGQLDFLDVLEHYRPARMLAHHQAVVMHASLDDLENSGDDEWLYELNIASGGLVQRHDLSWTNEIAILIASGALPARDAGIQRAAESYWSGIPSEDPVWEYLAAQAVIVAVHRY